MLSKRLRQGLALLIGSLTLAIVTGAQTNGRPSRITQAVDEKNLTELKGNTHPLARKEFDQGPAPADLPMNRMLLLLQHTPEQEAAVNRLLDEQQHESSPNFHKWLTPEQYGEQFGPTDDEIQAVTGWLQSRGFQVARVAKGRHIIEFSGTTAQVQEAFHSEIHKYAVNGEEHWANASDPKIPSALAPVVAGVVSLHNFPKKPQIHTAGVFRRSKDTGRITSLGTSPAFSFPFTGCPAFNPSASSCFGVGPYDFATIYNVKPLWDSGIDGRGQTIAIVARTNINVQDIRDFRKLFGLPPNDPQIIVNGPDPGILGPTSASFDEIEAIADVSWSGAVAKNATIKMVASALTNTTDGVDLSSEYIIDNNLAPVMSESYAGCELVLGTVGNQFYHNQWQQAAAQGITAFVVTGDVGSPECDEGLKFLPTAVAVSGFGVNGLASTPYDVAVGGTDFNDYFNPTQYWSLTNDPTTQASALSYIPETASNTSCVSPIFAALGFSTDPIANCNNPNLARFVSLFAGSGGPSNCTISDGLNPSSCQGGYPKPAWQSGLGVPEDGKRDLPDVSLTMAGFGSFYIMCEADISSSGACDLNAPFLDIIGIGGTSLAGPSFAGIQALVSQKTQARQGNANYVYYKLAAEQPAANCNSSTGPASTCIFNDVTSGTNAMPCAPGSPDCVTEGSLPIGVLAGFNAGVGYDMATGLGSVNAHNLVQGWKSVAFEPTSTELELSPRFIVHGQPVNVEIGVTSKFGTPTGQVSLIASNGPFTLNNQSDGVFTLANNGTVSSTTQLLPGGFYTVKAHYGGDGVFGQSDSEPVSVAVSPEPSTTVASAFLCSTSLFICAATTPVGTAAGTPFSSAPYGTYIFLRADVAGKSGFGNATGLVQFTDGERLIPGDPYGLNTGGSLSYYQPATAAAITPNGLATFEPGAHHIRASYSGDSSFHPSSSQPVVFTITKAPTQTALLASSTTTLEGAGVTLTATVSTSSYGNPPAGKIAFFSGAKLLGSPVSVTGAFDPVAGTAVATAALTTTGLPVGQDNVSAKYIGDENYVGSTSAPVEITVTEQ